MSQCRKLIQPEEAVGKENTSIHTSKKKIPKNHSLKPDLS